MGLEANCEASYISVFLIVKNEVVPESIHFNFWSSINEECEDALEEKLPLVKTFLGQANFMKVESFAAARFDLTEFWPKFGESFFNL